MRTRPTEGRLELLGLIEDCRQGGQTAAEHRPEITAEAALRLLPSPAPGARGPEPVSGTRVGAPAGVSASVPQGVDAVESRVGPDFVAG